MKKDNIIILVLISILAFASCGEDRTHEYLEKTADNQWIYNTMKDVYLWKNDIKEPERSQYFTQASKFFSSLLNKNDKASFFTDTIALHDYGMSYSLMRDPIAEKPSQVYALVLFVEPNSPAGIAGIERGTWISAANNKQLTTSSQKTLLQGNAIKLATEYIDYDDELEKYFWEQSDTIEISASTSYEICDIPFDSIYTVRDKKVGYMLCNNFDGENFTDKTNRIIEKFITENVTDVVIDLRYNTGGKISNATSLASMLVPTESIGTPFCFLKDNAGNTSKTYNYSEQTFSVGDKKIYFIIGDLTQGAAELLVNSVNTSRSMYDVLVIGKKSAGINIIVEEFKSPSGFSINPATAIAYTSKGEILSAEGIKPDYPVDELEQKSKIYPLGSEQEYLLYNTFYIIENGITPEDNTADASYMYNTPSRSNFIK